MEQFGDALEEFPPEARPRRPVRPIWLTYYFQCKEFGRPLFEGGILDQPIEPWQMVLAAGNAYQAWLEEHRRSRQLGELNHAQLQRSHLG